MFSAQELVWLRGERAANALAEIAAVFYLSLQKLGQSICMKEQIYHEGGKCCLHPFKHCSVWSPSQPWAGSPALPVPVQLMASISYRSTGKEFYLRWCEPSCSSVQPRAWVSSPPQISCGKTWQPNTRQSHCTLLFLQSVQSRGLCTSVLQQRHGKQEEMQTLNPPSAAQSNNVGGQERERECGAHSNTKSRFCARLISVAG